MDRRWIRITNPPMKKKTMVERSYCAHKVTEWLLKQGEAASVAVLLVVPITIGQWEVVYAIESLEQMDMIIISLLKHVSNASIISAINVLLLSFLCVSTWKPIGMKKWILSKRLDWRRKYWPISLLRAISLNLFQSSQGASCRSSKDMMWWLRLIKVLGRPLQPSSQRYRQLMPNQMTLKSSFCLQTKL